MGSRGINTTTNSYDRDIQQSNETSNQLDSELIKRANEATYFYEGGDSINRMYQSNVDTIKSLDISEEEKQKAIAQQYKLNTEALKLQAKAINQYVSGPARLTKGQLTGSDYDRVVKKREEITNHINSIIDQHNKSVARDYNKRLTTALQDAIKNKKLSFEFEGETWSRKTLRGKTFTSNK